MVTRSRLKRESPSKDSKRLKRSFKFVAIEGRADGVYEVIFRDENGMSILARSRSPEVAKRKMNKFKKEMEQGKLLKEDKSVWKY